MVSTLLPLELEYYNSSLSRWEPVLEKTNVLIDFLHDIE